MKEEVYSNACYGVKPDHITITSPCAACGLKHEEELPVKLDDGAWYVDCPTDGTKIWITYA